MSVSNCSYFYKIIGVKIYGGEIANVDEYNVCMFIAAHVLYSMCVNKLFNAFNILQIYRVFFFI